MALNGEVAISLRDERSNVTTLRFDLGTFDTGTDGGDYEAALSAVTQIRGSLVDVTNANIASVKLNVAIEEDSTVPADADVTDEAVVSVYLSQAGEAEKLHTLRVPAPIDGIFLPDMRTVDTSNALLIQFVQQVAQHALVSDGEAINTALGSGGMKAGYWRSKSRR